MKITELSSPVVGDLKFVPGMRNSDLSCLDRYAISGKVPVEIYGFSSTASGRVLHFNPINVPSVKRCALEKFFELEKPL